MIYRVFHNELCSVPDTRFEHEKSGALPVSHHIWFAAFFLGHHTVLLVQAVGRGHRVLEHHHHQHQVLEHHHHQYGALEHHHQQHRVLEHYHHQHQFLEHHFQHEINVDEESKVTVYWFSYLIIFFSIWKFLEYLSLGQNCSWLILPSSKMLLPYENIYCY